MVHRGLELDSWVVDWVVVWEIDFEHKDPVLPGRLAWPLDNGIPLLYFLFARWNSVNTLCTIVFEELPL